MSDLPYGKELAKYKLERAREELDTAELLFKNDKWKAANNRAYYAVYYAITSVLCLEPVAFKRHKDTLAYFNKNYVHMEKFSSGLGRKIAVAEKIRNASDYDDFYIASKEETQRQLDTAIQMIEEAERFIESKL